MVRQFERVVHRRPSGRGEKTPDTFGNDASGPNSGSWLLLRSNRGSGFSGSSGGWGARAGRVSILARSRRRAGRCRRTTPGARVAADDLAAAEQGALHAVDAFDPPPPLFDPDSTSAQVNSLASAHLGDIYPSTHSKMRRRSSSTSSILSSSMSRLRTYSLR